MNEFLKYTNPNWNEVLTEQAERNSVCSGNSRNKCNAQLNRRIIKYGYPKKCPAIKHINNLIIF